MKKCVVVIPVYKKKLGQDEICSLKQCQKILENYDIKFICPESLDTSEYSKITDFEFIRHPDNFFEDTNAYSRMLLDKDFYVKFQDYEYMLIYQLDAWVFEDRLEYWCEQGYDYIGAPWFDLFAIDKKKAKMLKYAGNGGFSLRKIHKFIDILAQAEHSEKRLKPFMELYTKEGHSSVFNIFRIPKSIKRFLSKDNITKTALKKGNYCEDNIIVHNLARFYPLKLAESEEAKFFAFEAQPQKLFEKCGNKLPFGCHAFKKYGWDFWQQHIKLEN